MRLRLAVAYDGADFHGWAAQSGLRTVQGTLEAALAAVLRVPSAAVVCAGRTDAGVHARGQVCHVDVTRTALDALGTRPPYDGFAVLRRRLAGVLPTAIRVGAVQKAAPGFDARFSALQRRYVYRVCDDPAALDPLRRAYVLAWRRPLDVGAMQSAADRLIGEHDFAAFCRSRKGATTIRHLRELSWHRSDDGLLEAHVRADAFCHSMVRALVGGCLAVGEGRLDIAVPAEVLARRERDSRLPVVASHGLTLESVDYPPDSELAARALATRRQRIAADSA